MCDNFLQFLSAPNTSWPARAVVGVGWFAALAIVCLMPMDVASVRLLHCSLSSSPGSGCVQGYNTAAV